MVLQVAIQLQFHIGGSHSLLPRMEHIAASCCEVSMQQSTAILEEKAWQPSLVREALSRQHSHPSFEQLLL